MEAASKSAGSCAPGTGGGAEERVEFAPRGFFDVGRRNIGGKNRSVNVYTRASLRPKSPEPDGTERDGFGFSEYRLVGTFREPRAFGVNADLSLTGRGRAGRPVVVQLRAQRRQRGARPSPVPRDQGERALCIRHDPDVRRAARPGRSGAHRPHLPAGPPVRVRRRHLARHPRRRARSDAGHLSSAPMARSPPARSAGRSAS